MKTKIYLQDIVIIVALASTLLYVVANKLPFGLGSFRFLWGPAVLFILLITRPNIIVYGPMKFILLYGLLSIAMLQYTLWEHMSEWNQRQLLNEFYSLVVVIAIWSYYRIRKDYVKLSLVSKWAFVFIVITLITTNIALSYDIYIVRVAASGEFTPYQERIRQITGAAGYGYAQSFVILIPVLVYYIKKRQKMVLPWFYLLMVLALVLITLARAQVFANFVAGAVITVLAFLGFPYRKKTFTVAFCLGVMILVLPPTFYTNAILTVNNYFEPETVIHSRLSDVVAAVEFRSIEEGGAIEGRYNRYPLLFDALTANPLLGHASEKSGFDISPGGHLFWMNKLALWGIPGFLFFVFVLYKLYKSISSTFNNAEIKFYYLLCVLGFIILGLTKNTGGREVWVLLIAVIPGLFLSSQLNRT